MKIDVFSHFLPKRYVEALGKTAESWGPIWSENPALCQIDARLRVLDMYPDVMQVLNVATPPLETFATPKKAIELAKIANNEMAEMIAKYPNKFLTAIACLPLNDIDAAIEEADRAITQLHFRGVQIFTNIAGEPLDLPKFKPLYKRMAEHDLPLWIHPWLEPKSAAGDVYTNPVFALSWPFETTVAMGCLAQSGIFEDCPNIKFITHHCGGMIPFFEKRLAVPGWRRRVPVTGERAAQIVTNFRKFYGDTALYGNSAALMCGYAYFGSEHLLFGTDMPLGAGEYSAGYRCTLETIRSIERMEVSDIDKNKIFEDNAKRLLKLEP